MRRETIPRGQSNPDECMRCERALDDAAITFDLNQQQDTGTVLIYLEDESVQKALYCLSIGFKAELIRGKIPSEWNSGSCSAIV